MAISRKGHLAILGLASLCALALLTDEVGHVFTVPLTVGAAAPRLGWQHTPITPQVARATRSDSASYEWAPRVAPLLAVVAFAAATRKSVGARAKMQPGRSVVRATEKSDAEGKEAFIDSSAAQIIMFLIYFGLQSTMSFYMKWLLSKVKVSADLVGVPASWFICSSQQMVGFTLFLILIVGSRIIGKPYTPKPLANKKEFFLILMLSVSFASNIGLNLLSLSLIPLSLTMIIRACSPLSTALVQTLLMGNKQDIAPAEWACMVVGVLCASIVVIAKSGGVSGTASSTFIFGVAMSVASLFCGALDFVFKGILGTSVKLNALDTTCYNAIPVAVFTGIIGCILAKPVSATWATRFAPTMTDFAVFKQLFMVNPSAFGWVILSGLLAFFYNTFVTFIVVKLSPATTAFAGNFNKAATILISLILLEGGSASGLRGKIVIAGIMANIASFTVYNILKKKRKNQGK